MLLDHLAQLHYIPDHRSVLCSRCNTLLHFNGGDREAGEDVRAIVPHNNRHSESKRSAGIVFHLGIDPIAHAVLQLPTLRYGFLSATFWQPPKK